MTEPISTIWLSAGHALYRGPYRPMAVHYGSVHCLIIGLDATFTVGGAHTATDVRCALIPPRVPHGIEQGDGHMLFCFLDSGSPRYPGCRERMIDRSGQIALGHRNFDELVTEAALPEPDPEKLLTIICGSGGIIDPRIVAATKIILADPARAVSATDLARQVHLSTSRLLHLFSAQAGTSFRRYRIWARMLAVGRAVTAGATLTDAAVDAGFSDPSHFADTFHSMFGISATQLLGTTRIILCDR